MVSPSCRKPASRQGVQGRGPAGDSIPHRGEGWWRRCLFTSSRESARTSGMAIWWCQGRLPEEGPIRGQSRQLSIPRWDAVTTESSV